jgi:hypothetical protein
LSGGEISCSDNKNAGREEFTFQLPWKLAIMAEMHSHPEIHDRGRFLRRAAAKRIVPRFRLRTLLIAVLAYCCLMTWLGVQWRWREAQQRILSSLERLQPGVVSSGGDVVVLSLKSSEIRDEDLRHVGQLSSLEQLDLEYTKITDAGMHHLEGLKKLRYLSMGGTRISDDAMRSIGKLTKLEDLLLANTNVGDAGMAYLGDLTNLRSLDVGATFVGDTGLALGHLRQLETLWLHETDISDAGLAHLHGLHGLQQLEVMRTLVSNAGVENLRAHLPNLRIMR